MAMMKAHASTDDLKVLLVKNFLIRFESGVIVIKHWRMHNTLRKDRYTPTNYQEELSALCVKDNGSYSLGCQSVAKGLPQVSIGKDRLGKVSIGKDNTTTITNNNLSFLETEEGALFLKVCEAFAEISGTSNPEDFIAYNEARDWKGIGGEDVREHLVRYAKRWENGEESRNMITQKG